MKKIALIISPKDFKDEEYMIPKQVFEANDFLVNTVSYKFGPAIGADGNTAKIDILAKNLKVLEYSAIVFVGGPGASKYLEDQEAHRIIKQAIAENIVLGAICIAPVILAKAGALKNKEATVWSSKTDKKAVKILQQQGAEYLDRSVVVDKNIITANGPKSAQEFAERIVRALLE